MGDHRATDSGTHQPGQGSDRQDSTRGARSGAGQGQGADPLALIEQCLESFPEEDPRRNILYKLRHAVMLEAASHQQREAEFKKLSEVTAKLTAP
ncbi:MAG: hypothetical protein HP491_02815, partial [Nitrospira sp.]|nr:hypothetical protein [Nitrospira sp.]